MYKIQKEKKAMDVESKTSSQLVLQTTFLSSLAENTEWHVFKLYVIRFKL